MISKFSAQDIMPSASGFLIVGPAGSGKTQLAADMAELGKTLILYTDLKAGKPTYKKSPNLANIDIWEFQDIASPVASGNATEELSNAITELLTIPREEFPYKLIWLDSLTSTGDIVLQWAVAANAMKGVGGDHKFGDGSTGSLCPNLPDYGTQLNQIKYMINRLLLLPCIVGVIAHERDVYNKDGYMVEKVIDITGRESYARNIASRFSEIYRAYQKNDPITNKNTWEMSTTGNDIYPWCCSKGLEAPNIINGFQDIKSLMQKQLNIK